MNQAIKEFIKKSEKILFVVFIFSLRHKKIILEMEVATNKIRFLHEFNYVKSLRFY
jgi:hypothetical protein